MGRPDSPSKTVVSDCGPRTVAEDAGALRILKPLEFDLRRISSLLATQALNPKGHLLVCAGVPIGAQRASDERERNVLPLASGYAPVYSERTWEAPEMAAVTKAIERVLKQQEPHPALVLDRYWNVIRKNEAAPQFFGSFVDLEARKKPRNLLDLMFDPAGMRPFVEEWETVAAGLLQRVYRECVGHTVDEKAAELLKSLEIYPGVKELSRIPKTQSPVLPITFVKGGKRSSYFSLITTVGTPQCVTAQELRIECMFPADAES